MKRFSAALVFAVSLMASISSSAAEEAAVIKEGSKIAFDYILTVDGKVIETSQKRGPVECTQGDGKLIPGLTKQLEGMKVGDEKTIEVKPEEGYGNSDPAGIKEVPVSSVPKEVKPEVGMMLQMQDEEGHIFPAKVKEIKGDSIVVDLNHPLAGKILIFKVRIVSVK